MTIHSLGEYVRCSKVEVVTICRCRVGNHKCQTVPRECFCTHFYPLAICYNPQFHIVQFRVCISCATHFAHHGRFHCCNICISKTVRHSRNIFVNSHSLLFRELFCINYRELDCSCSCCKVTFVFFCRGKDPCVITLARHKIRVFYPCKCALDFLTVKGNLCTQTVCYILLICDNLINWLIPDCSQVFNVQRCGYNFKRNFCVASVVTNKGNLTNGRGFSYINILLVSNRVIFVLFQYKVTVFNRQLRQNRISRVCLVTDFFNFYSFRNILDLDGKRSLCRSLIVAYKSNCNASCSNILIVTARNGIVLTFNQQFFIQRNL